MFEFSLYPNPWKDFDNIMTQYNCIYPNAVFGDMTLFSWVDLYQIFWRNFLVI